MVEYFVPPESPDYQLWDEGIKDSEKKSRFTTLTPILTF